VFPSPPLPSVLKYRILHIVLTESWTGLFTALMQLLLNKVGKLLISRNFFVCIAVLKIFSQNCGANTIVVTDRPVYRIRGTDSEVSVTGGYAELRYVALHIRTIV